MTANTLEDALCERGLTLAPAPTGGDYQDCEGDGHYLCRECKHISAAAAARMER